MVALRGLGFSVEEIRKITVREAFDFLDASRPGDGPPAARMATPEENDAFMAL
ncbi:hypothetical protein GMI70_02835 [Eggerthellaceae bacterium zg-893]|nr:hypothetical protein [Eggerthellaceae bacterium zg-893]